MSPQFHVVYDDHLSTVTTNQTHMETFDRNSWRQLVEAGYDQSWGFEYDDGRQLLNPTPELDES